MALFLAFIYIFNLQIRNNTIYQIWMSIFHISSTLALILLSISGIIYTDKGFNNLVRITLLSGGIFSFIFISRFYLLIIGEILFHIGI